mmetsp:Transcript_71201/g.125252  ORF Transcript_71201/g.125252 Transcript_71201/m.125252 type:complete len:303 (-) Transcript_71201:420-1328(-)
MAETSRVATWNVWKISGSPAFWPERRPALVECVQQVDADVLMLQESHHAILEAIMAAKPKYLHVVDSFKGWGSEGQILWDCSKWEEVEHGAEDVGLYPADRRLFWCRLRSCCTKRTILVATAHLTWCGHNKEITSSANVRKIQARAIALQLRDNLCRPQEPAFFGGDLNEGFWPRKLLNCAGFMDCFLQLDLAVPVTHPACPSGCPQEDMLDAATLDWLTSNVYAEAKEACAVDMPRYGDQQLQASDHNPVVATYCLLDQAGPFRAFRPDVIVELDVEPSQAPPLKKHKPSPQDTGMELGDS